MQISRTLLPFIALIGAFPRGLEAQTPFIGSIVNYASGDARFSPGVLAVLRYGYFNPASDIVQIGGKPARVQDNEDGSTVTIQLAMDQPLGPTAVVLVTSTGNSPAFPITVDAYAPGILAPTRSQTEPWSLTLGCNSTAIPGELLSLFAVGLGAINAVGTVARPSVSVSGIPAEVVDSTLFGSPAGVYRVRFLVPPGDGLHLVTLTIGNQTSNTAPLPVGRAMLNLAATSFTAGPAAPESIETAYTCSGGDFIQRGVVLQGAAPDFRASLGGVTITVTDSTGVARLAPLYGVAASQVNYVVPAGTAHGLALVTAASGDRFIAESDLQVETVAPGLFSVLQVVRLRNGVQTVEEPLLGVIDMGPDTDQVYLVLYGTGIRFRSSLANVTAKVAGLDVPVEYAGPQGGSPGLDQVNLRLPRSLAGRGGGAIELTVDGKSANALSARFY